MNDPIQQPSRLRLAPRLAIAIALTVFAAYLLDQALRQLIPPQPFLVVEQKWLIDTVVRAAETVGEAPDEGWRPRVESLPDARYLNFALGPVRTAAQAPTSDRTAVLAAQIAERLGVPREQVEIASAAFDQNHVERTVQTAVVLIPQTPALLTAETLATRETSVMSGFTITVPAGDNQWLQITPYEASDPLHQYARVGFSLLGHMLIIAFFSLWLARSIVAPLSRLAHAAEQLGLDHEPKLITNMHLPEHAAIARSFNAMQLRIKSYIDQRMQLLAAISHDLRTPLTRLRLLAEYLPDPEQRGQLLANLSEMDVMVTDALDFMSGEAHREETVIIDVAALLISLCDDQQDLGEDVCYAGPDHLSLACRPLAIKRAFSNLIANGCKYGGHVRVSLASSEADIVVDVSDNGPGIPLELRERAFEPFQRIEASRNRDTGGTGLGLAIARDVIHSHGGSIGFVDGPEGFTVRVTIPA